MTRQPSNWLTMPISIYLTPSPSLLRSYLLLSDSHSVLSISFWEHSLINKSISLIKSSSIFSLLSVRLLEKKSFFFMARIILKLVYWLIISRKWPRNQSSWSTITRANMFKSIDHSWIHKMISQLPLTTRDWTTQAANGKSTSYWALTNCQKLWGLKSSLRFVLKKATR